MSELKGWGCSSVGEYLPSMCKAMGPILSMQQKRKRSRRRKKMSELEGILGIT
jgi:hypothetical protein